MSTVFELHCKKLSLTFEFSRQRSVSQINKQRRSDEKHGFYGAQDIVVYETDLIFTESMFFITQI